MDDDEALELDGHGGPSSWPQPVELDELGGGVGVEVVGVGVGELVVCVGDGNPVLIEKVGDGLCVVGGVEVVGGGVYVGVGAGRLPFAAISWWLGNFSCGLPAR